MMISSLKTYSGGCGLKKTVARALSVGIILCVPIFEMVAQTHYQANIAVGVKGGLDL